MKSTVANLLHLSQTEKHLIFSIWLRSKLMVIAHFKMLVLDRCDRLSCLQTDKSINMHFK